MKKLFISILCFVLVCSVCSVFASDVVTYDFGTKYSQDPADMSGVAVKDGFHVTVIGGKLVTVSTFGIPVTYSVENISLEDYKYVSFSLKCMYLNQNSKLEVKFKDENGITETKEIALSNTSVNMYTVSVPESIKKLVAFEIFVNSIPSDNSMYDVELDYIKFHKSQKLMLLQIGGDAVIDDKTVTPDSPAVIKDGFTLTPARLVAESFAAQVEWVAETRTVVIKGNGKTIELKIDSDTALVDGIEVKLDMPATIINDFTYTPARFVAETLGCKVDWDGQTKTVFIER